MGTIRGICSCPPGTQPDSFTIGLRTARSNFNNEAREAIGAAPVVR